MKIDREQLSKFGLSELSKGRQLHVPSRFQKEINLLFDTGTEIAAVVMAKHFKDYAIYAKIMCLLNQLVRYYQRPVTIYCLSYRVIASQEKKYIVFSQKPSKS